MINFNNAEAKKDFKKWVKEFLSNKVEIKPNDV